MSLGKNQFSFPYTKLQNPIINVTCYRNRLFVFVNRPGILLRDAVLCSCFENVFMFIIVILSPSCISRPVYLYIISM